VQELDGSEVSTLRWINERAVLRLLFESDSARSVTDIASSCALSRPTVEGALAQLLHDEWVIESAPERSGKGAGRPAKRYAFADRSKLIVGVDLGPHGVVCAVATLRGEPLATTRSPELDLQEGPSALDALISTVHRALAEAGGREQDVIALAVGLPAIVGLDGRIALTVVVPQWREFDLPERVRERFAGIHVMFENDAKLATVAEYSWGSAIGTRTAVNVIVGHRVAAGMIIDGRLARGTHGGAGEIGALPAARWGDVYRSLEGPDGSIQGTLEAVASGDPVALQKLQTFADDLSQGIAAICLVLDPEVVVIGGGVAQLGERLISTLQEAVCRITLFPVELRASTLGQSAVARGGVALCRDHVTETVLQIA